MSTGRKTARWATWAPYVHLTIFSLIALVPFIYIINTALHVTDSLGAYPLSRMFENLTLTNFGELLIKTSFPRWTLNSLVVTLGTTAAILFIDALAGYTFAKKSFPGRDLIFGLLLATTMVPVTVTLIPTYLMVSRAGMVNTYWGLILPGLATPVGVFMMRQYFLTLPDVILDAARVDGASEITIFLRIVLPLARSPLTVLAVFTILTQWNNFLWPLVAANADSMKTITAGMAGYFGKTGTPWGLLCSAALLSTLPILVLFSVLQRNFVEALTASAYKG